MENAVATYRARVSTAINSITEQEKSHERALALFNSRELPVVQGTPLEGYIDVEIEQGSSTQTIDLSESPPQVPAAPSDLNWETEGFDLTKPVELGEDLDFSKLTSNSRAKDLYMMALAQA